MDTAYPLAQSVLALRVLVVISVPSKDKSKLIAPLVEKDMEHSA